MSPLAHPPMVVADRSDSREAAGRQGGGFTGLLWLTWRQHRWALVGSLVLAAVLTGWMAYLAADLTAIHHQCHDTRCPSGSIQDAALSAPFGTFRVSNNLLQFVEYLPLLVGMFLGVPLLAREHEQRTLLLAWSQDVSPVRWLWTKLALLGMVVAALTAAISAVSDHLAHAMADVVSDSMFVNSLFLDSGMLPLALSVCWFAVGVALGAAARRILPAAIAVVVGFVALQLVVQWRYPTLMTPLSRFRPLGGQDPVLDVNALQIKGGLAIGPDRVSNLFDSSGHALNSAELHRICPDLGPDALFPCLVRNHLETFVEYQPGSRIPAFHLILASGYLGIGALALAAVWLLVRRTSLSAG